MPKIIRRRTTLGPLPSFKWDETDYEWSGTQPTTGDPLPIAYLRWQLEADGHTIYYESPKAQIVRNRLRVPCILLGGPEDLFTGLLPDVWKNRFDRLGIVHASLPERVQFDDGTKQMFPAQLWGLPVLEREDDSGEWDLKNFNTYLGYRVYVWLGSVGLPEDYYSLNTDNYVRSVLPSSLCESDDLDENGEPYSECEDSFCEDFDGFYEYEHAPIGADLEEIYSFDTTLAMFTEHAMRFNGYRVAAWCGRNVEQVYVQEACACGTGDDAAPCQAKLVFRDDEPVMIHVGDTSALEDQKKAAFDLIWNQLPNENRYLDSDGSNMYDILIDALLFYEKLPL